MQRTVIVVSMHTRTATSYTTTFRACENAAEALQAAVYLADGYDCLVVTKTDFDDITGEPVGNEIILAIHGEL